MDLESDRVSFGHLCASPILKNISVKAVVNFLTILTNVQGENDEKTICILLFHEKFPR
jgi:hypothetical protein